MDRYYNKAKNIILALATISSLIVFINEDITVKICGTIFIVLVSMVVSFLVKPISKKMIQIGDRIKKKYLQIIYYVLLLPVLLLMVFLVCMLIVFIYESVVQSKGFSTDLSGAVIVVFLYIAVFVMFVVPYIQSLIVLFLRRIEEKK